ncbi:hypothetical protein [Halioxenophilus aromaticivorans]|uniref:Uncharacterized protein n=1 Tax=Halioxenophilus aromaticivorans TaxID=1306992 RepID=A0AAV3U2Y8_9ALTE
MSDSANKHEDQTIDTRDLKESMIEIESRFLKIASIQTILSVAAVFTGVIALYAALVESHAVRKQTTASVWPYVQAITRDNDNGEAAYVRISLNNVGVGPAKMQQLEVQYKGQDIGGWEPFIAQLDKTAKLGINYGKSDVQDRVLAPKETLLLFQTDEYKLAQLLQKAIANNELAISYCYCSIFDDCWLKHLPDSSGNQPIKEVDQCPTAAYSL